MSFKIEKDKKYRITSKRDNSVLDFHVMTIDRKKDEVYIKIVYPTCSHEGIKLSSMENRDDILEIKQ
jgi:hypothetical protein